MSTLITKKKQQTSHANAYYPGNEECYSGKCHNEPSFNCNSGDWTFSTYRCQQKLGYMNCPESAPMCAPIDPNECSIGLNSKGEEPMTQFGWDGNPPNLICSYDLDKIDRYAMLLDYQKLWGTGDDLMTRFCKKPANPKDCPMQIKSCSILKSTADGSDQCREWYAKLPSDHERDAIDQDYCFRNSTDDCRCINRNLSDEYNFLKRGNPMNDKCWFIPCANPSVYFVPSELTNGDCPANVCSILFETYKDRDVHIYDNDIVCNFGPPSPSPIPDEQTIIAFVKKYWIYPTLLIILFAIYSIITSN